MGSARLRWLLAGLALAIGAPARAQDGGHEMDDMRWGTAGLLLVEKLEIAAGAPENPLILEAIGWYGGARNRLWYRLEGEQPTAALEGHGELHAYYGRLVAPFWDVLVGARLDQRWGPEPATRGHLAVGLVGLAPLRFELSPTLFISHEGHVSARLEAEYQLLITQRFVLAPEVELDAALQDAPAWGIGAGLTEIELGLRARYELARGAGPYLGVAWWRRFGGTADIARHRGEPLGGPALVAGARIWL